MVSLGARAGWAGVAAWLLGAGICPADQGRAPAVVPVYVQAGAVVTSHPDGPRYHRVSPPLTGTTVGGAAAVGVRLAPALAVELEAVVNGALSRPQSDVYRYRSDYTAESRDLVIGLHVRVRSPGRVPLELTAGGGVAHSRFARRNIVSTDTLGLVAPTRPPDTESATTRATLAGALAMALPARAGVEIVPAVGARWINRRTDSDAWYFGVGRYQVFGSVSLRVTP